LFSGAGSQGLRLNRGWCIHYYRSWLDNHLRWIDRNIMSFLGFRRARGEETDTTRDAYRKQAHFE